MRRARKEESEGRVSVQGMGDYWRRESSCP